MVQRVEVSLMVEGCDSRVVVELRGQRAGSFARVRGYGLKRGVRLRGWGRQGIERVRVWGWRINSLDIRVSMAERWLRGWGCGNCDG